MIRILIDRLHSLENKRYISAAGLSTDEKPLENLITGSVFSEIDTGKLYKLDAGGTDACEQGRRANAWGIVQEGSRRRATGFKDILQFPASGRIDNPRALDYDETVY